MASLRLSGRYRTLWQIGYRGGSDDHIDRSTPTEHHRRVLRLIDTFFSLGPFGFRGPGAVHLPPHLTFPDGPISTAQVIAPGYSCPSNAFLSEALRATGDPYLSITSANRSRHVTGGRGLPRSLAGGRAAGSATSPGFHRVEHVDNDRRPHLVLERQGSLASMRFGPFWTTWATAW